MMRLSMSRPLASVPKGCAQLGGSSRSSATPYSKEYGASSGAKAAVKSKSSTIASPIVPSGWFLTKSAMRRDHGTSRSGTSRVKASSSSKTPGRAATTDSRMAHPRVEPAVGQVDDQVRQDDRRREQQVEGLDHRVVAVLDRFEQVAAHTRQHEDLLEHDRAADQYRDLQADQRDDRDQRVAQRVPHDDRAGAQSLGTGRPHVVLAQHVEHLRPRQPQERA